MIDWHFLLIESIIVSIFHGKWWCLLEIKRVLLQSMVQLQRWRRASVDSRGEVWSGSKGRVSFLHGMRKSLVPGMKPRIVKRMLIRRSTLKPRCQATAMGGRKMARRTLKIPRHVKYSTRPSTIVLCLGMPNLLGGRVKFVSFH